MSELSEFQREVGEWGNETFKHSQRFGVCWGLVKHLEKEVSELRIAMDYKQSIATGKVVGEELADCFILLLNLAELYETDLLEEAQYKMEINRKRKWGKPGEDGVIEHV